MADYRWIQEIGTPIAVFGETGGTILGQAVTHAFSVDALASGSAYQSDSVRLNASGDLPRTLAVLSTIETGTSPTAGNTVDIYPAWAWNDAANSNTARGWPQGVTGSDGAFTAALRTSLGLPLSAVMQNVADTVHGVPVRHIAVLGHWLSWVLYNSSGQAIRNEGTNSDNGTGIVVIAVWDRAKEVA